MQMHALLVAILLAGGNPVWDQQKTQQFACEHSVTVAKPGLLTPKQTARRPAACETVAKPIAEAVARPAIQAR